MNTVSIELRGHIALITLNRPKKLNALSTEILTELESTVDAVGKMPECRCVVILGAGDKAFAAGADTKELENMDAVEAERFSKLGSRTFQKICQMPTPVIAAVNGFALGGGCELALACDIRIASEGAVFGLPETTLGIYPGFGGTQRLPALIGHGLAASMIFTGEIISASRALEIGLVNAIVPQRDLLDEALAMAVKISKKAPLAIQGAKRAMLAGVCPSLEQGFEKESTGFGELFSSADTKGGIGAFNRKEEYCYEGK